MNLVLYSQRKCGDAAGLQQAIHGSSHLQTALLSDLEIEGHSRLLAQFAQVGPDEPCPGRKPDGDISIGGYLPQVVGGRLGPGRRPVSPGTSRSRESLYRPGPARVPPCKSTGLRGRRWTELFFRDVSRCYRSSAQSASRFFIGLASPSQYRQNCKHSSTLARGDILPGLSSPPAPPPGGGIFLRGGKSRPSHRIPRLSEPPNSPILSAVKSTASRRVKYTFERRSQNALCSACARPVVWARRPQATPD